MFCGIAPTRGWFGIAAASCIFYVWFLRSHGSVAHPCSSRKRAGCDRVPDHRDDTVVQLDDLTDIPARQRTSHRPRHHRYSGGGGRGVRPRVGGGGGKSGLSTAASAPALCIFRAEFLSCKRMVRGIMWG